MEGWFSTIKMEIEHDITEKMAWLIGEFLGTYTSKLIGDYDRDKSLEGKPIKRLPIPRCNTLAYRGFPYRTIQSKVFQYISTMGL